MIILVIYSKNKGSDYMHPYRIGLERAFFPNEEIKIKENLFLNSLKIEIKLTIILNVNIVEESQLFILIYLIMLLLKKKITMRTKQTVILNTDGEVIIKNKGVKLEF